ncbi:DUF3768 domain-containing protein [Methylocystis iwaonis]|uniref:DUF3768 domain-containing protein n=1 Tax=Methylocystis iwaonis TaxID=2885079 RepID=UPI0039B4B7BD
MKRRCELFQGGSSSGEPGALPLRDQIAVTTKVMQFEAFTPDNDPHGEHDFGAFDHDGQKIFWKNRLLRRCLRTRLGSPRRYPAQTTRVFASIEAGIRATAPAATRAALLATLRNQQRATEREVIERGKRRRHGLREFARAARAAFAKQRRRPERPPQHQGRDKSGIKRRRYLSLRCLCCGLLLNIGQA